MGLSVLDIRIVFKNQEMQDLLNRISSIVQKFEQMDLDSGSRFNVFSILNLTTDEVRLHSKFIAELLNPNGSHGQGAVFLKIFVDEISVTEFSCESASVYVEKRIEKNEDSWGYIDIFIDDYQGNSIIIENKIYAYDQKDQILRYYNFRKENVYYLNLFGTEPSKESYGNLKINEHFKIISYKDHIISWLEKCRKEAVEIPLVREGISHYINLIKLLTGQSNSHAMEREIIDLITSSSQNLKSALAIEPAVIAGAKTKIQWDFWERLRKRLENTGGIPLDSLYPRTVKLEDIKGFYEKSRNKYIYYGLWFPIYEKDGLTMYFGIEFENIIYYGFTLEKNGERAISGLPEYSEYKEFVTKIDADYKSNDHWLGFKNPEKNLNFGLFNSQAIFDLADESLMDETVGSIATEAINHIKQMQEKLSIKSGY